LERAPEKIQAAVHTAVANFNKAEARLYTDLLLSVAASVAKAHDEKDDMVDIPDPFGHAIANTVPFFERLLAFMDGLERNADERYLYDAGNVFDEMKISQKETS